MVKKPKASIADIVFPLYRGPGVPIEKLGFPTVEWMSAVDELVDGALELISESGELNLHTATVGLQDLRRLAEKVRHG